MKNFGSFMLSISHFHNRMDKSMMSKKNNRNNPTSFPRKPGSPLRQTGIHLLRLCMTHANNVTTSWFVFLLGSLFYNNITASRFFTCVKVCVYNPIIRNIQLHPMHS